jgi:hypothetical protein
MSSFKKTFVYVAGVLSGIGIAAAALSGASGSVIPYKFKDGEVISADTLNDLFDSLRRVSEGYSSIGQLEGAWSCKTYDLSGATPTNGMPNFQFSVDSSTGMYALDQTWTFSNGGKTLTIDKVILGGVAANNTGGCGSGATVPSASYSAGMFGPFLGLAGVSPGCTVSNSFVLDIRRLTPYKFISPVGQSVVSCEMAQHAPETPQGLQAALTSSGVNLSWSANTDSPTGYKILKKTNGTYSELASSTANNFVDSSGSSGDMYRIAAYNGQGNSVLSSAALAK